MELTPKTRKEVFLAAAGGQDVTTPMPITREEVFLNEIAKGGGGSSLPSTETASAGDVLSLDDNKEPQWATPSGGGGVLVVHLTWNEDNSATLDKTWQEIHDADAVVIYGAPSLNEKKYYTLVTVGTQRDFVSGDTKYVVVAYRLSENAQFRFVASSASGYPVYVDA